MYRVLVVDDEPAILMGIKNKFKWNEWGFEIIAMTTDSQEAFDLICIERPDVVLTDIRMPELNGIDLMKQVRARGIDTEFVIISGFAEFSYAQEAISTGAFSYILKPIGRTEADELIQKLSIHLEKKFNNFYINMFDKLLSEKTNVIDILKSFGFKSSQRYYLIVIALFTTPEPVNIRSYLNLSDANILHIRIGLGKLMYIINSNSDVTEKVKVQYVSIKNNMLNVSLGVSSTTENPDELSKLIKQADVSAYNYFLHNTNNVWIFKKSENAIVKELANHVLSQIDSNSAEEISVYLKGISQILIDNELDMRDVEQLWNLLYVMMEQKYETAFAEVDMEIMDYDQIANRFQNIHELIEQLIQICSFLKDSNKQQDDQIYNTNFKSMLDYIENHYSESIQIKALSEQFYISSTHCCRLFKKIIGKTYSEYITDIRMQKAKEYLKNKNLTITDVCYMCGYKDYFHFNKVFKKNYGITPASFQKSQ